MANEPTGRALAEAAARAMEWIRSRDGGWGNPETHFWQVAHDADGGPNPSERECLAWLHERRDCIILGCYVGKVSACASSAVAENVHAEGRDLREALARLVVAVAAREAQQP